MMSAKKSRENFLDFLARLHANQSNSATKAEDQVYSLIGLANRELREQQSIHYDNTPVVAYQTFAKAILLFSAIPSFLDMASSTLCKRPLPSLPYGVKISMTIILGLPQLTEYGPQAHKTRLVIMPGLWGSAAPSHLQSQQ